MTSADDLTRTPVYNPRAYEAILSQPILRPCPPDHEAIAKITNEVNLKIVACLKQVFGRFCFNLHLLGDKAVIHVMFDKRVKPMEKNFDRKLRMPRIDGVSMMYTCGTIDMAGTSAELSPDRLKYEEYPLPGASIGALLLPSISGSLGFYVQDQLTRKIYVMTCAHNIALYDPAHLDQQTPPGRDPNELLPTGTKIQQPSLSDYKRLLNDAEDNVRSAETLLEKTSENYPIKKLHIKSLEKAQADYAELQSLEDKLDFATVTDIKELAVSMDAKYASNGFSCLFDYVLLDPYPERLGANIMRGYHVEAISPFRLGVKVIKQGRTSGFTRGMTLGMKENVGGLARFPKACLEFPSVQLLDRTFSPFAAKGDSGAGTAEEDEDSARVMPTCGVGFVQGIGRTDAEEKIAVGDFIREDAKPILNALGLPWHMELSEHMPTDDGNMIDLDDLLFPIISAPMTKDNGVNKTFLCSLELTVQRIRDKFNMDLKLINYQP